MVAYQNLTDTIQSREHQNFDGYNHNGSKVAVK